MEKKQVEIEYLYKQFMPHAVINNIKFQATRESIITQSSGNGYCEELTVNVLDAAAPALVADSDSMDAVCRCVENWVQNNVDDYEEIKWQADLIEFASKHKDIVGIYASAQNADDYEFVIIMEDATDKNVFSYNKFCFEFAERYTNVTDFMVIDVEEAQGCHDLLRTYDMIYTRG